MSRMPKAGSVEISAPQHPLMEPDPTWPVLTRSLTVRLDWQSYLLLYWRRPDMLKLKDIVTRKQYIATMVATHVHRTRRVAAVGPSPN